MKKLATLFLAGLMALLVCPLTSTAQNPGDTIVVKSLNYSSATRDTTVNFPDLQGITFEKILMRYNMRCRDGAINTTGGNNVACGEWDYSCNTYIHDSSRVDSINATANSHIIGGFSGGTFNYTATPTYSVYQHSQRDVSVNNINSETQSTVGAGSLALANVTPTTELNAKSHYLFTAAELTNAGVVAGDLDGILIDVTGTEDMGFFRVKVKHTTKTALDAADPDLGGWTEVFYSNVTTASGQARIQFYQPFTWDGTSNIVLEMSFTNQTPGGALTVDGNQASAGAGMTTAGDRYHVFHGTNYIETNGYKGVGGSADRTVEAWIKTSVADKEIVSWGRNATGQKWVFRVNGGGQLRVEVNGGYVIGTTLLNDDEWHHVAAVFSGSDVTDVDLYVDGNLDAISSSLGEPINTDVSGGINLRVSRGVNNRYWTGGIDEVRLWDAALNQTELQNWMHRSVDNSHPSYGNLQLYYNLNEGSGNTIGDQSPNGHDGMTVNGEQWDIIRGQNLNKEFATTNERPNVTFLQGSYSLTISNVIINDTVNHIPTPVIENQVISNAGTVIDDQIVAASTFYFWEAGRNYLIDTNGVKIDSTAVAAQGTITVGDLPYIRRWPMKMEIMSFVTPYGIGLDMGMQGKTWTFDLTDFTPILTGDKRMTLERGGQWQEEMDIEFWFIVGTPPRDVLDIRQIWKVDSRGYTSIINDDYFAPRDVPTLANGDAFKIRTAITGHGQEGEFIARTHWVDVNGGGPEFSWNVWKECAENPVYPQGGTWIYDRAGWCPGMATDVQHFDITDMVSAGSTVNIDYGMNNATGTSNYIVSNQLVSYGPANHTLDAALVEVQRPSMRVEYARDNSICHSPVVVIRNTGSETLTSLTINYWINNASTPESYSWTGSLEMGESEVVTLPSDNDLWDPTNPTGNVFHAQVANPNGSADEYSFNDSYASPFEIPEVMPAEFELQFNTNSAGAETSYEIVAEDGTQILSRSGLGNTTNYRDTVNLDPGCYSLKVYDSDDDGISFFANQDGNGAVRIWEVGGIPIKLFEPDYGDGFTFTFTVGYPLSYEEINYPTRLAAYPNPASDRLTLELDGFGETVDLSIYSSTGQLVNRRQIMTGGPSYTGNLDISELSSGMYLLRVEDGAQVRTVKVMVE